MIPNAHSMFNFDLGETADAIRETVRDFSANEIAPRADEIDKSNQFPRDLWPKMGELGLLGMTVEEEFGGSGLDYLDHVAITRHRSWDAFEAWRRETGIRLVLATTTGSVPYTGHAFRDGDCLLMGRESAGVPEAVHAAADARVVVPIRPGLRSLNVAVCAAMMLGEAIRQVG